MKDYVYFLSIAVEHGAIGAITVTGPSCNALLTTEVQAKNVNDLALRVAIFADAVPVTHDEFGTCAVEI